MNDEGTYLVTQTVTLDDTIDGVARASFITNTFTIILTDPCGSTTIETLDADGEIFSLTDVAAQNPFVTTSVLVGTDTGTGAPVEPEFNI